MYYRGEKIGFTVSQTVPTDDGFELQEDGRLQMSLLGARKCVSIRTRRRSIESSRVRSFEFSPRSGHRRNNRARDDPATGGCARDRFRPARALAKEDRELAEIPVLPLNFARRLADAGLRARSALHVDDLRSRDAAAARR